MGFMDKDFNNPVGMFAIRTRQLRVRIQTLQSFLVIAQHPYSRAIVKQELDKCSLVCANCHREIHYKEGSDD